MRAILILSLLMVACSPAARSAPESTSSPMPSVLPTGSGPDQGAASRAASAPEQSEPPVADSAAAVESMEGWATWCAPTPKYCKGWGGSAMLGAVRSFRYGDQPYPVRVRYQGKSVVVTVVSYCACGDRNGIPTVIDLSPAAFRQLADQDLGVIMVAVEPLKSVPTLPATETQP